MNVPDLSEDAKNVIDAMGEDIIRRQQYIDFIRCRRFRSSLVCRDDVVINREPGREVLSKFYVESQLRPLSESFEIADESPIEFGVANGSSLTTSHPMTKAALIHFGKHSGEWKRFDDIVGDAKELLRGSIDLVADEEVNKTATWFLKMFDGGIVKFHKFQPKYQETLTERPTASACARWQVARRCNSVTSMAGKNNTLEDPFTIALLPLLDGSRDLEQLIDALKSAVQVSGDQRKEFEIQLPDMLDEALTRLADAGYLIA
jgi:methyltransferase-like protein